MAEVVEDIIKTINETNATESESILKKTPATTEGMLIAYTSLVVMALVPIFLGSFRSVKLQVRNKVSTIIKIFKHLINMLKTRIIVTDKKRGTRVHD